MFFVLACTQKSSGAVADDGTKKPADGRKLQVGLSNFTGTCIYLRMGWPAVSRACLLLQTAHMNAIAHELNGGAV